MSGSRMIRVLKRDGNPEPFSAHKLAAAIARGMKRAKRGSLRDARDLAGVIQVYLQQRDMTAVSSAAVFEMTLKVLHRVGMDPAANAMEAYRFRRSWRRRRVCVDHGDGRVTTWSKAWLGRIGGRMWHLAAPTTRIISALVEEKVLRGRARILRRQKLLDLFSTYVSELGLADAVPVQAQS